MDRVLMLNYFADRILDSERAVKQVVEADHSPVGQEDELVGGGATDGGLVQVDAEGHFGAGEWLQIADAVIQKFALAFHQALGNLPQRIPALLDAIDEELGPAGAFLDEVAVVGR